jgi:predicted dehydrogenase
MAPINIGVVGLGRFGRLHARVLSEIEGCRIRALCEVDQEVLQQAGKELGIQALYTDLEEMLAAEQLDAVDIVTDEALHGTQAQLCLEHDCAVFVEKPLATTSTEAHAVATLARSTGLPVVVGNISRFDTRYALVRRELEAGHFGHVALVNAKRSFSRAWFAGFGGRVHPVFESMIHDLDLVLWYLPAPVQQVYAQTFASSNNAAVPDVVTAILTATDGSLAVLQSTWLVPDGAPITLARPPVGSLDLWGTIDAQIEIIGTAQSGRIDLLANGLSIWNRSHVLQPETGLWPEVHGRIQGALREELFHFLECVRIKAPSTIMPHETAVNAVVLAEAIVRSAREGQPVQVLLTETSSK